LTFLRERRETFLALAACLIVLATSVPTEAEGLRYVFVEWRDFTADARADARALLRMSAGLETSGRFPWPLRRALAADRRMVEGLLRRWDAGAAPAPESYRALQLASTRFQAAQWRPGGWYFVLW